MKDEREVCVPLPPGTVYQVDPLDLCEAHEVREAHDMLDRLGIPGCRGNPLPSRIFNTLSGFHNGRPLPTESELVRAYLGPLPDMRDGPAGSVKGVPECARSLQGGEVRVVREGVKKEWQHPTTGDTVGYGDPEVEEPEKTR